MPGQPSLQTLSSRRQPGRCMCGYSKSDHRGNCVCFDTAEAQEWADVSGAPICAFWLPAWRGVHIDPVWNP